MAHFAQLDENNIVTRVIVVSNNDIMVNGVESEQKGIDFCKSLFGQSTKWVQTSYNSSFRVRYASIGYSYASSLDAFITPKPYPSWILNTTTYDWVSPVPKPNDSNTYWWDESTQSWKLI